MIVEVVLRKQGSFESRSCDHLLQRYESLKITQHFNLQCFLNCINFFDDKYLKSAQGRSCRGGLEESKAV